MESDSEDSAFDAAVVTKSKGRLLKRGKIEDESKDNYSEEQAADSQEADEGM